MRPIVAAALCVLFLVSPGNAATKKEKAEATAKLLAAADAGDEDDILEAIAAGADVNVRTEDGRTPLMMTSSHSLFGKERAIVEAFVNAKARVDDTAKDGTTALMTAASMGRDGIVRLLLQNGASVNKSDNDGWAALMYASANGHWSVVKELIAAKADVKAADKNGWTPLMVALAGGHGSAAEKLIKAGAPMPAVAPNGLSAVLLAAQGRDLACVRLALESGSPVNSVAADGWTALELASGNGDGQIVMDLLRAGADASIKDKEGKTALDRAVEFERTEIAAILGGAWKKRALTGGTTLSVPCPALGGTVAAHFAVDEGALVVTTTFPRPLTWYLGGGNMNRAASSKAFVYQGSFTPTYTLGAYAIDYMQYGTSVGLRYVDRNGEERVKSVYANVLDVRIRKGDETVDTSAQEGSTPAAENDGGVLVTRVPLALLKLTRGTTTRATATIGECKPVSGNVRL